MIIFAASEGPSIGSASATMIIFEFFEFCGFAEGSFECSGEVSIVNLARAEASPGFGKRFNFPPRLPETANRMYRTLHHPRPQVSNFCADVAHSWLFQYGTTSKVSQPGEET
jgi:hypothetical protein